MAADIQIKITGDKEVASILSSLHKEFEDTSIPLDRSSRRYMNDILANFSNEGTIFGDKWKRLSKSTIRDKKAEGVAEPEKPLVRTGLMRNSFNYNLIGKNESILFNAQEYARIHQEGGTATYNERKVIIPKRILAAVDKTRIDMVAETFRNWVNGLINKHGIGK